MNIDEIKVLLGRITQGDWQWYKGYGLNVKGTADTVMMIQDGEAEFVNDHDYQFIAAAPEIVRELLAEVEMLRIENAELTHDLAYALEFNENQTIRDGVRDGINDALSVACDLSRIC